MSTSMKVVKSCEAQGYTFYAPPGHLYAEVTVTDDLNEDTDAGH